MKRIPGNRFCLYIHVRPDTMQIFYVGIGLKSRPYGSNPDTRNKHWNNIVAKNNGNFIVDILCENQEWESVCQMEIALIKFYGREDVGTGILCNMTDGGDGRPNPVVTEKFRKITGDRMRERWKDPEFRAKMALLMATPEIRQRANKSREGLKRTPESIQKMRLAKLGKKTSDETKEKLRIASTGRAYTNESKTKQSLAYAMRRKWVVDQVCIKTGHVLNTYPTIAIAASVTGIGFNSITMTVNGYPSRNTAGGFKWRKNFDKEVIKRVTAEHILTLKIEAA